MPKDHHNPIGPCSKCGEPVLINSPVCLQCLLPGITVWQASALTWVPKPRFSIYALARAIMNGPPLITSELSIKDSIIKGGEQVQKELQALRRQKLPLNVGVLPDRGNGGSNPNDRKYYDDVLKIRNNLMTAQKDLCAYCSQPGQAEEMDNWELDMLLPVPFQHGASSPSTRADFYEIAAASGLAKASCPACNEAKAHGEKAGYRMLLEMFRGGWAVDGAWLRSHQTSDLQLGRTRLISPQTVTNRCGRPTAEDLKGRDGWIRAAAVRGFQNLACRPTKPCRHPAVEYFGVYVNNMRTLWFGCDECLEKTGWKAHFKLVSNLLSTAQSVNAKVLRSSRAQAEQAESEAQPKTNQQRKDANVIQENRPGSSCSSGGQSGSHAGS